MFLKITVNGTDWTYIANVTAFSTKPIEISEDECPTVDFLWVTPGILENCKIINFTADGRPFSALLTGTMYVFNDEGKTVDTIHGWN